MFQVSPPATDRYRTHMSEWFAHMRLVHNAQTLISLTAIYLVWSSWNSGAELRSDLTGFLRTVQIAGQIVENPERLDVLIPETHDYRTSLNRELSDTLGHPVVAVVSSLPIQLLTSFPEESAPIGAQWQDLRNQRWRVSRLIAPSDDLDDIRVWLEGWRRCLPVLRRHLQELRLSAGTASRRFTTPMLLLQVVDEEPPGSSVVSVMVDARVYLPQRAGFVHPCRRSAASEADLGDFVRDDDREILREHKRFGLHPFAVRRDTVGVPRSTFGGYPYLERALDTIGEFTPTEALTWAAEQQQEGLRRRDARLFGTSIPGEHLRYVGPVIILGLHLYMLVTLCGICSQKWLRVQDPVPWLAATPSLWPTVFSGLTLAVVPAIALGLILWRLTIVPVTLGVVLVALSAGIGVWIVVWARRLGLQHRGSA